MAIRDIEVDHDRAYHLAPGFLLSISGAGIAVFPQLTGQNVRRAQRGTIPFVAALSRQEARSLNSIIDELVAGAGADRATLVQFVDALAGSGALLVEPPRTPFAALTPERPDASAPAPDALFTIVRPSTLVVDDGTFLLFDHGGTLRMRAGVAAVNAAIAFGTPRSVADAWQVHRNSPMRLAEDAFAQFVKDAFAAGLLRVVTERDLVDATPKGPLLNASPRTVVEEQVARVVEAHDREEAQRAGHRTPVVPVNADPNVAPLSLALLVAHASEHDAGRLKDQYNFVPEFLTDEDRLLARAHEPSIFLFSNYLWNMERNLALSKLVKHTNPNNITIHGGPNTPKYEGDAEQFFAEHDHVDVAVHGEGEATFTELLTALDGDLETAARLEVLHDVAGLTFRTAGGVARTGGRERIADLDTIPSPYLLGLLDSFGAAHAGAIIETNRGCPYGCTFCDWGSATLSRIRKFSLERVFGELEWSAQHEIEIASIADANFGIMERDVEIAQKIADLKRQYGYPRTVATNYAKNTVKWLRQIIEIFADVEILTEGVVSLQSMDEPTLKIIRRSNIKLEKYNELSTEFRRARLPLAADIMMGLPGSTPTSFRNDLQQCTNRDVRVRANPTQLLPNSPMNEPEYRQQYGIVAKPGEVVMESSTFTRAEWDVMNGLRRAYYIFDNWGVLRYVARFVRQEAGIHEVDFYDRVQTDVMSDREQWPIIATTLDVLEGYMAPPGSWGLFVEEVGRYVTSRLGVADDTALRTALDVQLAHLPAPARRFPFTISLAHDFAAWQDTLLAARESAHRDDWELVVPRLSTYGPATLTVSDPNDICSTDVGKPMGYLGLSLRSWELESPVARPRLGAATSVAS